MTRKPLPAEQRMAIEIMQEDLDALRSRTGVSDPGRQLTMFIYDGEGIIAAANGNGSAKVTWYEDLGEDETLVYRTHEFDNEQEAYDAVEWLRKALSNSLISLSDFFASLDRGEQVYSRSGV